LENFLDSIAFVRKIISSHRGVKGEPDRPREVIVEEKMSIIFHGATGGAMFINVDEYLAARSAVARARLISLHVKVFMRGGRFLLFHALCKI